MSRDAWRLALGTLTVLPVRPPARVDRSTAGSAMVLAPVVGLVLAVPVAGVVLLLEAYRVTLPGLPVAVLLLGALALLTRGMHLDGLADTADGLGSGRDRGRALAVMRRSDIGPFGVVTLVLVLLLQVSLLAECLAAGTAAPALVLALVLSRGILPALCTPAWRSARADGLGHLVSGSVTWPRAAVGTGLTLALAAGGVAAVAALGRSGDDGADAALAGPALLAVVPGLGVAQWAARRLGGMTGDVYGAAVEVTFTAVLLVVALAG